MSNWRRPKLPSLMVVTLLPIALGCFDYLCMVPTLRAALQAPTWPEIACEIIESRVDSYEVGSGKSRSVHKKPVVRYRYEIGGEAFVGSTIAYIASYGGMGDPSAEAIQPYPKGLRTTCRVDPKKHSNSVLDPTVSVSGIVVLGAVFGGGFLFLSAAAAFWWWRYFKMRPAA